MQEESDSMVKVLGSSDCLIQFREKGKKKTKKFAIITIVIVGIIVIGVSLLVLV